MFVPGLGAFVRMEQYPTGPREDARVGLAGPRLLFVVAAARAIGGRAAERPDGGVLALYLLLVAALTALTAIRVTV